MPNLMWTWSRLRQMDVAEMGHRVVDAARSVWEGLAVPHRWPSCPDACVRLLGADEMEQALLRFREGLARLAPLAPGATARQFAEALDTPEAWRIVREAEDILDHRIRLFGYVVEFGEEIDWHWDPVHGRSIPLSFYGKVDYRDPRRVGEVKLTWELNRHQHLLRLAQAYLLTRDGRYIREAFAQIESWAAANPPLRGVNWTRALELALRLVAWSWTLAVAAEADEVSSEAWMRVLTFAAAQWRFLQGHFSYGSSANNHLLGELLGAAWAGAFLFRDAEGEQAVRDNLQRLFVEIDQQVYPDGVSRELSVYYHAYVLVYGLLGLALAERLGFEVPARSRQKLHKMGKFLLALHLGDGMFPSLGDDDGGHVLPLAPEPNLAVDALDLWGATFGEAVPGDLQRPLGLSWWLFGFQAEDRSPSGRNRKLSATSGSSAATDGNTARGEQLVVFPEAGYAVHRKETESGPTVLIFDAGPLGDDKLAAHGHADALSLFWAVEGEEILVDPGTYAYDGDPVWRNALRGTPAHNTVTVDGQWQSRPGGTFLWLRRASARLLKAFEKDGVVYLLGEHDGYSQRGVKHRRAVLGLNDRTLVVRDQLLGRGHHRVEQRFHLPDGVVHWCSGQETIQVDLVEHAVRITPLGWSFDVEVHRMAGPEEGGWLSDRFGSRAPALTLVLRYEGELPTRLTTLLIVSSRGQDG